MKLNKKAKIVAIFIAYNAEKTLKDFYKEFPKNLVDKMILVDDHSKDKTYQLSKKLGIPSFENKVNLGYGDNMKKAICLALKNGADIIIDIHPDGEYKPSAIPQMIDEMKNGAEFVLGNRFTLFNKPLKSGMFLWKVIPLRVLNLIDNLILNTNIKDFHQGFRGYSRKMLEKINFEENSNNYLFSFELIVQAVFRGIKIAQVPVETSYTGEKRGASLKNSIEYSLGTFKILWFYILAKLSIRNHLFENPERDINKRIDLVLSAR